MVVIPDRDRLSIETGDLIEVEDRGLVTITRQQSDR
jgi:hypothetical protein